MSVFEILGSQRFAGVIVTQNRLYFRGNGQLATGCSHRRAAVEESRIQEKGHRKFVSQRLLVAHRRNGMGFSKRVRVLVIDMMCGLVGT
jgi:hypothetical protein